ncbi:MAG: hypothetical protein R3C05_10230 [Pirellulaceae bacterium]
MLVRFPNIAIVFIILLNVSGRLDGQDASERVREKEIVAFFEQFSKSTQDENGEGVVEFMDVERFVDELVRTVELPFPPELKPVLVDRFQLGLGPQLQFIFGHISRVKVVHLFSPPDGRTAVATVRFWDDEGYSSRFRFWLAQASADNEWRFHDLEDLSSGMNYAYMTAVGMMQILNAPNAQQYIAATQALSSATVALTEEDFYAANVAMQELRGQRIPPVMQGPRWMIDAIVFANIEDTVRGAESLEKLTAFEADFPMASYLWATVSNLAAQPDRAIEFCEDHIRRFGADAEICMQMGAAWEAKEDFAQAIQWYRKGLVDTPNLLDNLALLGSLLPEDKLSELDEHIQRLRNPQAAFPYLADSFFSYDAGIALERLADAWNKTVPDDHLEAMYYQVLALQIQNKHNEAMKLATETIAEAATMSTTDDAADTSAKEDSDEKAADTAENAEEDALDAGPSVTDRLWVLYYESVVAEHRTMEAYDAADDKQLAVEKLYQELSYMDQYAEAETLLRHHLKSHPDESTVLYWLGNTFYYRDQFQEAGEFYSQALAKQPDEDLIDEIKSSRLTCLAYSGKADEAIESFPDQLANLFWILMSRDDTDSARRVLDSLRTREIDQAEILQYEAALLFHEEKYEEWLELALPFARASERRESDGDSEIIANVCRALIHLQRFAEARPFAQQLADEEDRIGLLLNVLANLNKLDECRERMITFRDAGNDLEYLLYDDDCEPILYGPLALLRRELIDPPIHQVMLLTDAPVEISSQTLISAIESVWQIQLHLVQDLADIDQHEDGLVPLSEGAFLVSTQGHQFCVQAKAGVTHSGPDVGDFGDEAVNAAFASHKGKLVVEAIVWPEEDLTPEAQQSLCKLALKLANASATLIRDPSVEDYALLTEETRQALSSTDPLSAFENE